MGLGGRTTDEGMGCGWGAGEAVEVEAGWMGVRGVAGVGCGLREQRAGRASYPVLHGTTPGPRVTRVAKVPT